MTHELKIANKYFEDKIRCNKKWEIRKVDRAYKKGDILHLAEWERGKYTGRSIQEMVTAVYTDVPGLEKGYVIMSTNYVIGSCKTERTDGVSI